MSFLTVLRNPAWNLSKSAYDEVDQLPLMQNPEPVLMLLAFYLLFVLKLGPSFMRKREAFQLTFIMAIYNAVQVALSVYLVYRYFRWEFTKGFLAKTCFMNDDHDRKEILISIWWYFAAKISELVDTVFFVLRKKDSQVTFLHLYHHSVMMVGTWTMLKYSPSNTLIFLGLTNSLVHVVMYSYYGLAAFGPKFAKYLKWKKYITTLQLVQFVSLIIYYILSVSVCECPPTKGFAIFVASNSVFFLLLFLNFYKQTYNARKENKKVQ